MVEVRYEEDGEIFAQENWYSNVTGEAVLIVPAHGNNSAVQVIMQGATLLTAGDNICQGKSLLARDGLHLYVCSECAS